MFNSRIFRNRWAALLWAGGILWTAYDVASAAPAPAPTHNTAAPADEDASAATVDKADLAVLMNTISG
ncbi:MAG: hypothetical protein M3R41_10565 [Pseudomonadota bacterium]|nr:hypothetical protein [Pseudomonadota bacterium]